MIPIHVKKFLKISALFALAIIICSVSYFRLADHYELGSLDLRFILRYPKIPTSDKIIFIEIGQDTIDKLGRFPFDRNYHALLVKALTDAGAEMVLFDFLFSEPQEHDRELEYALNQARNVYLPYAFDLRKAHGSKGLVVSGYAGKCLEGLAKEAKGTGHINIVPDPDGKFRRIPVFVKYEDTFYPHISFVMGCDHLGLSLRDSKIVPIDEDFSMIINFSDRWGSSYRHYSYADVLQSYFSTLSGKKPGIDPANFKDKICIVGLTAAGTGDAHPVPLEPLYPGMGIHAEVINSMINKNFVLRASRTANLAVLLALVFLISIVTLKTKPSRGLFILLSMLAAFFAFAVLLFNYSGIWIDVVYPAFVSVLLYLALTLYKYMCEWKNRLVMENELGIAKKIQESFLPKKVPEIKGFEIAAAMSTARQVGGDLYDFVELGGGAGLGIMIGDVSGKGVPASLFMAMVTGGFKFFSKEQPHPEKVLSGLNLKIVGESSSNLFVTMFYALFNSKDMSLTYSNGGHLPLLRVNREGIPEFLDSSQGMPLGLLEGPYSEEKIKFSEGDVFVFYTDGITEAMNSRSELYEAERLVRIVKFSRDRAPAEILKAIFKDVRSFEPKSKQHDDMTVIIVKV